MPSDFESCKQKISELVVWAANNDYGLRRNEAQTRLHLIDGLVFDCLGWEKEDCEVEESHERTYADYVLGRPGRLAVVEAKREGVYFELPTGFERTVSSLLTVRESSKEIDSALRQALGYCQQRGIGVAVVCNGHQLIAFLASRQDGVPPLQGMCLVYTSLEQMRDGFRELWDVLSKPGLAARNIYTLLRGTPVLPPPQKLSQRIQGYPGFKGRNPFQTELQILGELVLEDIARARGMEKEFLERCYCSSGALSQYALISKRILQTRYSSSLQVELEIPNLQPVQEKSGLSKELTSDLIGAAMTQRPVILVGDVGVGKTIFIRHLINVDAPDILGKSIVLYIDFGHEPALSTDLQDFVLKRCADQLLRDYKVDIDEDGFVRGIYIAEMQRFEKGIFAPLKTLDPKTYLMQQIEELNARRRDRAGHLKAALEHITKARNTPVVLFLDNIDQRPSDFQDQVFLIGQAFASTWPATVFISLRPDTLAHSKVKGSLSAYYPRVFTVSPPRVDLVLKRRLNFALDELGSTGRLGVLPENLTINSTTLSEYLHVLVESFERSDDLVKFIDNLSGGNTRQAIEFMTDFVGSGHVDAQKILETYRESGSYTIPVHEFLRAIIFRDHEHYDPTASRIANLFDISSPDGREHFLVPNVVSFAAVTSGTSTGSEGYVDLDQIFGFGQGLGFDLAQVRQAIERCLGKKLLEANPKFGESASLNSVRITTIGAYTVQKLSAMFAYVDAMVDDTPIVDVSFRNQIGDASTLRQRLARADIFRKYLDAQWSPLQGRPVVFDWMVSSMAIAEDIRRVESRLPKN